MLAVIDSGKNTPELNIWWTAWLVFEYDWSLNTNKPMERL
jgi:hypothetical protein